MAKASYRYYLLQDFTTDKPSKPTTYPSPSTWSTTEPTYTSGSTKKLYLVDCVVFNNNTFIYSNVSLSSSYEAAKAAYTKATSEDGRQIEKDYASRRYLTQIKNKKEKD